MEHGGGKKQSRNVAGKSTEERYKEMIPKEKTGEELDERVFYKNSRTWRRC